MLLGSSRPYPGLILEEHGLWNDDDDVIRVMIIAIHSHLQVVSGQYIMNTLHIYSIDITHS